MNLNEDKEIDDLLNGIFTKYGYDFRNYSRASIKRRVLGAVDRSRCVSITDLLQNSLSDPLFFKNLINDLTVSVTEMFRDPAIYLAFRNHVIPLLKTYPSIRIWHAGCATGEEVYAMAILLYEEGLYDRTILYGTDVNPRAIERAKEGIYSAQQVQGYTANYQKAGGMGSLADYYTAKYGSVKMAGFLKKNIFLTQHNLATDDVFSEVHMVLCRNVLIYFSRQLQERSFDLFNRSLIRRGFLCLGSKETLEFSKLQDSFAVIAKNERLYKKI